MKMNPGGRRLKQWLIEQINSNIYNGLLWEDENRTMFRIPWKHAGKQDYNQEVDASIFKVSLHFFINNSNRNNNSKSNAIIKGVGCVDLQRRPFLIFKLIFI